MPNNLEICYNCILMSQVFDLFPYECCTHEKFQLLNYTVGYQRFKVSLVHKGYAQIELIQPSPQEYGGNQTADGGLNIFFSFKLSTVSLIPSSSGANSTPRDFAFSLDTWYVGTKGLSSAHLQEVPTEIIKNQEFYQQCCSQKPTISIYAERSNVLNETHYEHF